MGPLRPAWAQVLDGVLRAEGKLLRGGEFAYMGSDSSAARGMAWTEAEKLDFFSARSAWTYFKRLWSFGLLERRSRGRGTLEYRISELGRSRLCWLRSQGSCFSK
jgi:hypothetical protein